MSLKALLSRFYTSDQGTFGRLRVENKTWFSGELPFRNNENDFSDIPEGFYECSWTWSNHFKRYTYELRVPGRFGVRIHPANFFGDAKKGLRCQLEGCICLGEKVGQMEGQRAILLSAPAIREFETLMNKQPFLLEVKNEFK
jgi:hypothetical protein